MGHSARGAWIRSSLVRSLLLCVGVILCLLNFVSSPTHSHRGFDRSFVFFCCFTLVHNGGHESESIPVFLFKWALIFNFRFTTDFRLLAWLLSWHTFSQSSPACVFVVSLSLLCPPELVWDKATGKSRKLQLPPPLLESHHAIVHCTMYSAQ